MRIVLFVGGARSGKSRAALERARQLGGDAVTFLATGRAVDAEMAVRIDRHRAERPSTWQTIEAAGDAAAALARARHPVVVLDCLTFLVSDAFRTFGEPASEVPTGDAEARAGRALDRVLAAAAARDGWLLVVTNEVGAGVVPITPLGRAFRDAQGRANQRVAQVAEEVTLLVCGLPVQVKSGRPFSSDGGAGLSPRS